ncbi:MAG: hypothetical protein PHO14_06405 [Kiritimatiellae bacterium]|nr:hypothetical protein [Kiritimatiellia bacterium]
MRYSRIQWGWLGLLLAGLLTGCGASGSRGAKDGTELPLETPPGLKAAKLLYQRADGIYLQTLGQGASRRLAANGGWPRWAPDGKAFVFLRGNHIVLFDLATKSERVITEVAQARTVAFHPDGRHIFVASGKSVRSIALADGRSKEVLSGSAIYELDVAASGDFLVATVKSLGYRVRRYALPSGASTELGRGCSASVSPDGRLATINVDGHHELRLVDTQTGGGGRRLMAPEGFQIDNQKWSNHPDWITGIIEGEAQNIVVQRVSDGQVWRVTDEGDGDRPDLWVE